MYNRRKGKGVVLLDMEVGEQICVPSSPCVQSFKEGDMVHVFEGTGVGRVKNRDVGWFGKVVGREGDFYLVRNRLLAARGPSNRVEAQYMKVQVDFGLTIGSEERVHFRSLSKRTRDRIMLSSDEHNNWQAKDAQKQLAKAKKQKKNSQQKFTDALEHERQRCERTIEIQKESLVGETQKNVRKIEREWESICNGLKKQLGLQQTQVVHLELQQARIERAGKVREEALDRKACTLRMETIVRSLI